MSHSHSLLGPQTFIPINSDIKTHILIFNSFFTSKVLVTHLSWNNIHVFMGPFEKVTFVTDYPYFICIFFPCLQSQIGKPAHSVAHSSFSRQSSFSIPANTNFTLSIRNLLHRTGHLGQNFQIIHRHGRTQRLKEKAPALSGATFWLGQRDHPTTTSARGAGTCEAISCHSKANQVSP